MKFSTKVITINAIVGALYVVLTLPFGSVATGFLQIRPAEALTILPAIFPCTIWGLAIGCAISNIVSAFGVLDIVLGALVTALAGIVTAKFCKKSYLAPIPPVLLNATLLPLIWLVAGSEVVYVTSMLSLLVSQSVVCFGLGIPLYYFALKKLKPLWDE